MLRSHTLRVSHPLKRSTSYGQKIKFDSTNHTKYSLKNLAYKSKMCLFQQEFFDIQLTKLHILEIHIIDFSCIYSIYINSFNYCIPTLSTRSSNFRGENEAS